MEFARLRAAHLVASGAAQLRDGEREELDRLLLAARPPPPSASTATVAPTRCARRPSHASNGGARRAGDPFAGQARREVCETAARTAETIYAAAG